MSGDVQHCRFTKYVFQNTSYTCESFVEEKQKTHKLDHMPGHSSREAHLLMSPLLWHTWVTSGPMGHASWGQRSGCEWERGHSLGHAALEQSSFKHTEFHDEKETCGHFPTARAPSCTRCDDQQVTRGTKDVHPAHTTMWP